MKTSSSSVLATPLAAALCLTGCAGTTAPATAPPQAASTSESTGASTPPQGDDLQSRLLRAIDDAERDYDRAEEARIASELRVVFAQGNPDQAAAAMTALKIMQHRMRKEFDISDQDIEASDFSIGVYLLNHGQSKAALPVLLREARFLSSGAQQALNEIYEHGYGDIPKYEPSIFEFYKQTAREGIRRSELELGKAALNGWGVVQDHKLAVALLQDCELPDAFAILADDARAHGDEAAAQRYLAAKKKLEAGSSPN